MNPATATLMIIKTKILDAKTMVCRDAVVSYTQSQEQFVLAKLQPSPGLSI